MIMVAQPNNNVLKYKRYDKDKAYLIIYGCCCCLCLDRM